MSLLNNKINFIISLISNRAIYFCCTSNYYIRKLPFSSISIKKIYFNLLAGIILRLEVNIQSLSTSLVLLHYSFFSFNLSEYSILPYDSVFVPYSGVSTVIHLGSSLTEGYHLHISYLINSLFFSTYINTSLLCRNRTLSQHVLLGIQIGTPQKTVPYC